ncbi:metallophosphoesterase [Paenibacillus pinihumi]|uniref:metallophosphoesterase n=1 Tax=Paenibacillus pinihumi TaxID=669462 RepID=UPI0004219060|nr:metallophosphoesterase [Paenibacillus pinihumi]
MVWIGLLVLSAAGIVWMLLEAFRVRVKKEEVVFEKLPAAFDGLRLFFISDIHRRAIPERLIELCQNEGGADLVVIGGDIREQGVPLHRIRDNIRQLRRLGPVYAVYGNHDYDESIRPVDELLRQEQAVPLINESVVLNKGSDQLVLCGVDDPITGREVLQGAFSFLNSHDKTSHDSPFTILVSHDPNLIDWLDGLPVDLMLSGHTHGGQIALPLIGPLSRSSIVNKYCRGWFPAADSHSDTRTRLLVSCGFGTSRIPLRLLAPSETHLLILRNRRVQ